MYRFLTKKSSSGNSYIHMVTSSAVNEGDLIYSEAPFIEINFNLSKDNQIHSMKSQLDLKTSQEIVFFRKSYLFTKTNSKSTNSINSEKCLNYCLKLTSLTSTTFNWNQQMFFDPILQTSESDIFGGLYVKLCYCEHSCSPNASIFIDSEKKLHLFAKRRMDRNEPITISYMEDLNLNYEVRQQNIFTKFKEPCSCFICNRCVADPAFNSLDNLIRTKTSSDVLYIRAILNSPRPEQAIQLMEKLISLLECAFLDYYVNLLILRLLHLKCGLLYTKQSEPEYTRGIEHLHLAYGYSVLCFGKFSSETKTTYNIYCKKYVKAKKSKPQRFQTTFKSHGNLPLANDSIVSLTANLNPYLTSTIPDLSITLNPDPNIPLRSLPIYSMASMSPEKLFLLIKKLNLLNEYDINPHFNSPYSSKSSFSSGVDHNAIIHSRANPLNLAHLSPLGPFLSLAIIGPTDRLIPNSDHEQNIVKLVRKGTSPPRVAVRTSQKFRSHDDDENSLRSYSPPKDDSYMVLSDDDVSMFPRHSSNVPNGPSDVQITTLNRSTKSSPRQKRSGKSSKKSVHYGHTDCVHGVLANTYPRSNLSSPDQKPLTPFQFQSSHSNFLQSVPPHHVNYHDMKAYVDNTTIGSLLINHSPSKTTEKMNSSIITELIKPQSGEMNSRIKHKRWPDKSRSTSGLIKSCGFKVLPLDAIRVTNTKAINSTLEVHGYPNSSPNLSEKKTSSAKKKSMILRHHSLPALTDHLTDEIV